MKRREKKTYSKEFRARAVHLYENSGTPRVQLAKELGVPYTTLYNWAEDARLGKAGAEQALPSTGVVVAEQAEIARLKRELERVTLDRDFLKKAAAFFAKNQS